MKKVLKRPAKEAKSKSPAAAKPTAKKVTKRPAAAAPAPEEPAAAPAPAAKKFGCSKCCHGQHGCAKCQKWAENGAHGYHKDTAGRIFKVAAEL